MTTQEYKIGDCLELMRELEDNSIDLVLTDSPYGVGYDKQQNDMAVSGGRWKVSGGRWKEYKYYGWDEKPIGEEYFREMLRVSKNQIIWGGNYYPLPQHSTWLIWNKIQRTMTHGEMAWTSFNGQIKIFDMGRTDAYINKEEKVHPTQKPVALFRWILENYSKPGDKILDPFLGSGTTLMACRQTERQGLGFEINKDYEPAIRKRIMADIPRLDTWGAQP